MDDQKKKIEDKTSFARLEHDHGYVQLSLMHLHATIQMISRNLPERA